MELSVDLATWGWSGSSDTDVWETI